MIDEVRSHVIRYSESGEALAHIRVTQERNGCAIWYEERGRDPRLLSWHGFSPRFNSAGVVSTALIEAKRIAGAAVIHGEHFAADRLFRQAG